ncbi:GDP-L-galactose phosphorylase 2-like [Ananas comosus]|uniref:GDP-L-galactose phosphorylase 2-like n=1 Tax=Ananas comosus TaxID=4615 RepID=A0A6P5FD50_ANACO|nr:GDP-L-galactose phosphorylase 2-like [Ananas comosus]
MMPAEVPSLLRMVGVYWTLSSSLSGNLMLGGVSLNTMSLPANLRWNAQFLKEFENNFLEPLGFLKSNYMKNCKKEILFCVCQGEKESSELLPLIVLPKDGVLIIANGNPVEYGHVYLVPYVSHQLPLFWDRKILGLVTQIAVEVNNSSFRVFLDNASTTSGHIHFQVVLLTFFIFCTARKSYPYLSIKLFSLISYMDLISISPPIYA